MQTLAHARPEWWTNVDDDDVNANVNVNADVSVSDNDNDTNAGTDAVPVPVAATFEDESDGEDGPTIDLQAAVDLQVMEHAHASSPGTTQDETSMVR
jgi:hypothetical protein